jgi:hypothetical protein
VSIVSIVYLGRTGYAKTSCLGIQHRAKPLIDCLYLTVSRVAHAGAYCRPCLVSFAQLLVEIDTGKPFTLQGKEKFDDKMWKAIQEITTKGKRAYAQAIEGCLQLTKGFPGSEALRAKQPGRPRGPESSFDVLRQKIFQDVVYPLEKNYRRFPSIMGMPRDGPFDIPAISRLNDSPSAKAQPPPAHPTNGVPQSSENMFFFDDLLDLEMNRYVSRRQRQ